jgi:hypothetical protein
VRRDDLVFDLKPKYKKKMHCPSLNLIRVSKLSRCTTMPKQHTEDTLISDSDLKNKTHCCSVVADGHKTKRITKYKL